MTVRLRPVRTAARSGRMVTIRANTAHAGHLRPEGTRTMTGTATDHRRADAGTIRLGQRDIDGLILCAEHGGAPYDLLAAALGAQPARLRGITAPVAAGRVRRHRPARARPGLVLADRGRDDRRRTRLPRRPAPAGPPGPHPRACSPPGYGSPPARPGTPHQGVVAIRTPHPPQRPGRRHPPARRRDLVALHRRQPLRRAGLGHRDRADRQARRPHRRRSWPSWPPQPGTSASST